MQDFNIQLNLILLVPNPSDWRSFCGLSVTPEICCQNFSALKNSGYRHNT